jgi:hypothetical protein
MKIDPLSRRGFLQGAGAALALPILPSLLPREVEAQAMPVQKTFVGVVANNGLYRMYGPDSILMPPLPLDQTAYNAKGLTAVTTPRHTIHTAPLQQLATANGGKISQIVDSSFNSLLPKMNMIQGLDYLGLGWSHHQAHFGNSGSDASSSSDGNPPQAGIDQVLAYSSSFYKNPALKGRSVAFTANPSDASSGYQAGYMWSDPANPMTSNVVFSSPIYTNPATLFDAYFQTQSAQMTPLKQTLVDKVLADYKSLRQSNTRLGAADKAKLDLHISMIQQTQQKVTAVLPMCGAMTRPSASLTDRATILTTINSVITSLVACGYCNSFIGWAHSIADADPNNYHKWSHEGFQNDDSTGYTNLIVNQTSYDNLVLNNTNIMKDICLDLATKLDQVGQLDNTLIACVQEHNKRGHESWNVPVITFGSAGGVIKTGQYLDYRDFSSGDDLVFSRFSFPHAQFLANVMLAMGLQKSEFESLQKHCSSRFAANSGYGVTEFNNATTNAGVFDGHYDSSWQGHDCSGWLPGLT